MTVERVLDLVQGELGRVMPIGPTGVATWPALAPAVAWLRVDWWRRSSAAGWPEPSDWYHPAVDAVCEQLMEGSDPAAALVRLGAVRAAYGATVTECLLDTTALWEAFSATAGPGQVPMPVVTPVLAPVLEGWSEENAAPLAADVWQDPMTGLATIGYLRGRLDELCRAGTAWRHVFVVVDVPRPVAPLTRARRAASLAACLREAFHQGETLTTLGRTRVAALVRRDEALDGVARLRETLALRERILRADEVQIWLAEVPPERELIAPAVLDLTSAELEV
jgi:hypothetical protein